MHLEAQTWITRHAHEIYGPRADIDVVEFGSLDVNGGLRHLYPKAHTWIGVDIEDGPGVDIVTDAGSWRPDMIVDLVICAEVLEHTPWWRDLVLSARLICKDTGAFICTAACDPRAPHSAYDPDGSLGFRDGEYYQNVGPEQLLETLREVKFTNIEITVDGNRGDVYACARP